MVSQDSKRNDLSAPEVLQPGVLAGVDPCQTFTHSRGATTGSGAGSRTQRALCAMQINVRTITRAGALSQGPTPSQVTPFTRTGTFTCHCQHRLSPVPNTVTKT